ncbi:MAG: SPOR domain-containing protein, partial [Thermodesulfobacteriota bacterium]
AKEVAKTNEKSAENQLGYKQKSKDSQAVTDLPATDPSGKYTVQIGSFKDKAGAEKIFNSLKSKGYPVFMKTALTEQNETWFRIRIGTFNQREAAKKYFEALNSKEKDLNGFITFNN